MGNKREFELAIEEETKDICDITDILECKLRSCLETDFESVPSEEAGAITDMIKDMYEAKEKLVKACYYQKLMETMEKDEEREEEEREERKRNGVSSSKMYFPVQGSNSGSAAQRGASGPYDPNVWDRMWGDGMVRNRPDAVSGASMSGVKGTGGRRGFSFDNYMEAMEMHPSDDQESKRKRMESLNRDLDDLVDMTKEVASRLSPEEKQIWKGKISKILNA